VGREDRTKAATAIVGLVVFGIRISKNRINTK
jgi:hypothetical protein